MNKEVLSTKTDILISGNDLGIFTYFDNSINKLIAYITSTVFIKNGVSFLEGQLGYDKDGYVDVSFFVNENGELIVKADSPDRFNISSDGQLTITE